MITFCFISTIFLTTEFLEDLSKYATALSLTGISILVIFTLSAFSITFCKLYQLTLKYHGIFNNRKLIFLHFGCFLVAVVFGALNWFMATKVNQLKDGEIDDCSLNESC